MRYIVTRQPIQARDAEVITQSELDLMMNTGQALHSFISKSKKKIVLAISSDQGHTFVTDCKDPLYLPDPEFVSSAFYIHVFTNFYLTYVMIRIRQSGKHKSKSIFIENVRYVSGLCLLDISSFFLKPVIGGVSYYIKKLHVSTPS